METIIAEIKESGTSKSVAAGIPRSREGIAKASLVIENKQELGVFREQRDLLRKLNALNAFGSPVDLTVRFECEIAYVYGLALIAAWCPRFAANVSIEASESSVSDYLEKIGFINVVQNQHSMEGPLYDSKNHVALTQVLRQKREEADLLSRLLVDLFSNHFELSEEQRSALNPTRKGQRGDRLCHRAG